MKLQAVYELASRQHGAISNRQLRRLGISARVQRTLTARAHLAVAAGGVVVVSGSADSWRRRLSVGLLALGPNAFVSHEAAAALHGLDRSRLESVAFTISRGSRPVQVPGATVHTTTHIGPLDVVKVDVFPCTSATRTILDLAADGANSDRLAARSTALSDSTSLLRL